MMGNTIEFYAAKHNLDPAAQPDCLIGEDVISTVGDPTPGFRNMGDPMQDGDPSHVSQKLHRRRGQRRRAHQQRHRQPRLLPGRERWVRTPAAPRTSTTGSCCRGKDCTVVVPALGLDKAAQVFYDGFTSLPEYANFCDARNATAAAAGGSKTGRRTRRPRPWAWPGTPSASTTAASRAPRPRRRASARRTPPCRSQSPHPYGNNGDCTWTYDNGSAGFKFHFTLMDMEKDFDYVYVKDAAGQRAEHLHRHGGRRVRLGLRPDLDRLGPDGQRPGRDRTGLHHRLGDPLLTSRPA